MRTFQLGAAALGAFLLGCAGARADCKPLSLVTSLDFKTSADGRQIDIPASIAGHDAYMVLDTGAAISAITESAVDAFHLERKSGLLSMTDVSGRESEAQVQVPASIGRLRGQDFTLGIWHGDSFSDDKAVIGLFGADVLSRLDVDVDMAGKKVNLLSQDHCEGKVIYWPYAAVAVVPFTRMYDGVIQLTVKLDGQPVVAMLDTGATVTTLSQDAAEGPFGLKLGSADAPETGSLHGRAGAKTYEHNFKTLDFEGIAVANPRVEIIPNLFHSGAETGPIGGIGTRFADRRQDSSHRVMLIGMDIMRHFHFYIAYKEEKLYITPAEAPPPATASSSGGTAGATQTH